MQTLSRLAAAVAALAVGGPAFAHDVWVVTRQQGAETVAMIRYADPGKLELADRGKIVNLEVISAAGRINLKRPLTATTSGPPALESKPFIAPAGSILSVTYDNGFYVVSPDDGVETNTNKMLVPNPKESWWVPKFGKTLLGPGAYAVRSHTLMELIPLNDPYSVAVGGTLALRVELKGRALAGVKVVYGDGVTATPEAEMPSVLTDKDGVAQVPITRKGTYLIMAEYEGPPSQPALADKDDTYATLAFDTSQ